MIMLDKSIVTSKRLTVTILLEMVIVPENCPSIITLLLCVITFCKLGTWNTLKIDFSELA